MPLCNHGREAPQAMCCWAGCRLVLDCGDHHHRAWAPWHTTSAFCAPVSGSNRPAGRAARGHGRRNPCTSGAPDGSRSRPPTRGTPPCRADPCAQGAQHCWRHPQPSLVLALTLALLATLLPTGRVASLSAGRPRRAHTSVISLLCPDVAAVGRRDTSLSVTINHGLVCPRPSGRLLLVDGRASPGHPTTTHPGFSAKLVQQPPTRHGRPCGGACQ